MSIYASGQYLRQNPTWHEEDGPWKCGYVHLLLTRNRIAPATVIEIGTGSGEVLALLAARMPEASFRGFDISEQAMIIAGRKARPNLAFVHGSPLEGTARADLVLALDVFEHVEDYMGFLRGVRLLGEHQIYNIPLDLSARSILQKSLVLGLRTGVGHLHYFFKDTALATLADTGHEVIDWAYNSRSLEWGRGPLRWPIVALRRMAMAAAPDLAVRLLGGFSMTVLCRPARLAEASGPR